VDECDRASEAETKFREQALRAARPCGGSVSCGAATCIDCGEKIPEARRKAVPGCIRCAPCQEEFENYTLWRGR